MNMQVCLNNSRTADVTLTCGGAPMKWQKWTSLVWTILQWRDRE